MARSALILVWLRPDPADALRRLTAAVWSAFPDHPPYGGKFSEPSPHLTVAQSQDPVELVGFRRRLQYAFAGRLPIPCAVDGLSLFVGDDDDQWSRQHVFPFGAARP